MYLSRGEEIAAYKVEDCTTDEATVKWGPKKFLKFIVRNTATGNIHVVKITFKENRWPGLFPDYWEGYTGISKYME